jgi:hypothetical protein
VGVGLAGDGAGVPAEGAEEVGATVGCGVLVLDGLLLGVTRAVGLGVVAGVDVGTAVGEAAGCALAGESVAACCGLNSR